MPPVADWRKWIPRPAGTPFALCRRLPDLPGLWDLRREPQVLEHWVPILRANAAYVVQLMEATGDEARRRAAAQVAAVLEGLFADLDAGVATPDLPTIHAVTQVREQLLRAHGIADPFAGIKAREAERCLEPAVQAAEQAWRAGAVCGGDGHLAAVLAELLAGNLFDLGSRSTQAAFREGKLDIRAAGIRFRPWVAARLAELPTEALACLAPRPQPPGAPARGRALILADNAGPDFLLGVLPAALFWSRTWEVCLVVNSQPASSDVTYPEAGRLLADLIAAGSGAVKEALDSRRLRLLPSGTGSPGIDLRYVGDEFNAAAAGVAWMLIDGQGRGIETNWTTRFACPVLRAAVVKDPLVAAAIGHRPGEPLLHFT